MGYKLETTALISIDNYNAFRIRCIMLILENIKDGNDKNEFYRDWYKRVFVYYS